MNLTILTAHLDIMYHTKNELIFTSVRTNVLVGVEAKTKLYYHGDLMLAWVEGHMRHMSQKYALHSTQGLV